MTVWRAEATIRAVAAAPDLFAELDDDLTERYGSGEPVHIGAGDFDPPAGRLLVAELDGQRVGCAGVRPLRPGTAELKRMYVRPAARGRGVARALLAACEQAAAGIGYRRLWLETGLAQPEAIALYHSAGYVEVERFGQYSYAADSVYLGRDL